MVIYNVGDTVFFLNNGAIAYGQITVVTDNYGVVTYTVVDSNNNTYTVASGSAYPSAIPLISVTPTQTVTPTIAVTSSITPTPTTSLTLSSTVTYPNTFPSNSDAGWTSPNDAVSVSGNSIVFTRSATSNNPMTFTKTFTVTPGRYRFGLDYQQLSIRYGVMTLAVNNGQLYAEAQNSIQQNNSTIVSTFSDSGRLFFILNVSSGTELTLTFTFYGDSNYDTIPTAGYSYSITNTVLQQFGNPVISPTPTLSPTPTPSVSASSS